MSYSLVRAQTNFIMISVSDRDDFIDFLSVFDQLFQFGGNQTFFANRTVVAHQIVRIRNGFELVFENDKILIAEADDRCDVFTGIGGMPWPSAERLRSRHRRR